MIPTQPQNPRPWTALRQFVRPRPPAERCELCGAALAPEHPHLLERSNRQLHCSCSACAILFGGQEKTRYERVPQLAISLSDFVMSDELWDDLHLPINLAFFVKSAVAGRVQAYFPSPAGATESLLALEAWDRLVAENPGLRALEPDIEALLVNRLGPSHEYYRVSIDECYKLVGLIRTHWRGLSGGREVWDELDGFFTGLKDRSRPAGGASHA